MVHPATQGSEGVPRCQTGSPCANQQSIGYIRSCHCEVTSFINMSHHESIGPRPATGSPLSGSSAVTVASIFLLIAASYAMAPRLPNWAGWENGPVENLQVAMLCAGGLFAIRHGRAEQLDQRRTFWLLIAPIWFILAARELSWGACFMPPYATAPDTGPKFSSTGQLAYRSEILTAVAALVGVLLVRFVWSGQPRFLAKLYRERRVPFIEIGCVLLCLVASGAAEGHLHVDLGLHPGWVAQNFEEMVETGAYAALLLAQWRVFKSGTA
jgi:hypothetical protein